MQRRTASETPEQRQARLAESNRQRRTASETPEQRQARLEQDRALHCIRRQIDPQSPHFEQPAVHFKMAKAMESLQFHQCFTCAERFPNMNVVSY